MNLTIAILLLVVGFGFSSLLNGQTFTNSIVGMTCAGGALAIALYTARKRSGPDSQRFAPKLVAGLAFLFLIVLAAQLPTAYRFQNGFNRRVKELRASGRGAAVRPARQDAALPPAHDRG